MGRPGMPKNGCRPVEDMRRDEDAVSEILGVTMLLAMVVSVMASVIVVMQPFLEDLTDNREWVAGSVAATQFNDRLLLAADAPEGAGLVVQSAHLANTITPLRTAETWVVSADLAGEDRATVSTASGLVNVTSINRTAASAIAIGPSGNETWNLADGEGNHTLSISTTTWFVIDLYDGSGDHIHRMVHARLDGLRLATPMSEDTFLIDLVNGARIEMLPGQAPDVRLSPRLGHDEMLDGGHRVSLILLDLDVAGDIDRSRSRIELTSLGQETFFEESARNLKIETQFTGDDTRASKFNAHWTEEHTLHSATGDDTAYVGFGPAGRLSGIDGMTFYPTESDFHFDFILQQVEVTG